MTKIKARVLWIAGWSSQDELTEIGNKIIGPDIELTRCKSIREAYGLLHHGVVDLAVVDLKHIRSEAPDFVTRLRLRGCRIPLMIIADDLMYFSREIADAMTLILVSRRESQDPAVLKARIFREVANTMGMTQKRRHPRHKCNLGAFYEGPYGGSVSFSQVLTIGNGGMFIASDEASPNIGDVVVFRLVRSELNPSEVEGTAVVRWKRNETSAAQTSGFAVEFVGLTRDVQEQISLLVARLSASEQQEVPGAAQ